MPTNEMIWCVLLSLLIFAVASPFLLRVACHLVNVVGEWLPRFHPVEIPSYRQSLAIVFMPVVLLSIFFSAAGVCLEAVTTGYLSEATQQALLSVVQWTLFTILIGMGIHESQPNRGGLAAAAAILHVSLVLTGGFWLSRIVVVAAT
jgi:hypothetical protein